MIDSFLQHIKYEKRFSGHTVISYENDLTQFRDFIKKEYLQEDISDVTYMMIREWFSVLMENEISAVSVRRKKAALNSFYKFLLREGKIEENPVSRVISPKAGKRLPVFVPEEQMSRLFSDDIDFGSGFKSKRDKMILEMLYATGMRLSELVNLKDQDVNTSEMYIRVIGKRNKERIVPLGNNLIRIINEYRFEKQEIEEIYGKSDLFYITEKGKKIYQKLVYRVVNYYLSVSASISKKSPHILRHTFATHMLNKGADINAIKEILGHENLSATQIYTHNTIDKLKTIYKQAHPRA